ncbi:MAG TPA: sulfatase [Thermoguttaceae bacterium]|nr:sulfatase [Thermoguttaceae bacterium]
MSTHKIDRRTRLALAAALVAASFFSAACVTAEAAEPGKPNVLFIAVDDLRPQLGCYGHARMHSPSIDRLAGGGFHFRRAYCNVPVCGASRASLMTGIRPARNRFVGYDTWAEKDAAGITTLNTHFRNHGYYTASLGKVFHHAKDNLAGWSEEPWLPENPWMGYLLPESQRAWKENREKTKQGRALGPPTEEADAPDNAYADGRLADRAVADLGRLAEKDGPFFLAVGFYKPHLPFLAPKKYWDLYPADEIKLPGNYSRPKDAPDAAIHNSGELRAYAGVPKEGPVSDEMARRLIRGYYACVSFTDAQIGKLLDELDRLGIADETIVILWGDHGWNLGEHTLWCKHCCFETSMRVPLVVRAPGFVAGKSTDALVEYVDVYPSLCQLAGLPLPEHLDGRSFVPLMNDPGLAWKEAAIGRYGPGDTIRTDRYRFTEYTDKQGKPIARMLYDHQVDPGENVNVSERPESQSLNRSLREQLRARMGKASPRQ